MRACCFRFGYLFFKLTSLLKYTPWYVILNVRHNSVEQCHSIPIRFQGLLTPCHGFFSTFPSRYWFAIGLETYLQLEVSASQFHAPYPRNTTLDTSTSCSVTATGLSPCFVLLSSRLRISKRGLKEGPKHHIPDTFQCQIRFAVYSFQSLLLTISQLISFPAGTKMFQFPAFPDLSVLNRSLIRRSSVLSLHTARRGISPLVASFISASNQVFHLIGLDPQ